MDRFLSRNIFGGFLKWWYPTTMGFPTKNDHFGVFWGYHHLRKHPFLTAMLRKNDGLTLDIPSNSAALLSTSFPGQESQCPNEWGLKTNVGHLFRLEGLFKHSPQDTFFWITYSIGTNAVIVVSLARFNLPWNAFCSKMPDPLLQFFHFHSIVPVKTVVAARKCEFHTARCLLLHITENKQQVSCAHWNTSCLYVSLFAVFLVLPVMVNACLSQALGTMDFQSWSFEIHEEVMLQGLRTPGASLCNAFHMCILHFWILGCKVQSGWIYVSPCKMHRNCWKYSKTSQFSFLYLN